MKSDKIRFLAISLLTVFLVVFGLVMQFRKAINAVAVLQVNGMTCGACSAKVEKAIRERAGVAKVSVDVQNGFALAFFDSRSVDPRSLVNTVSRIGFPTRIRDLMTITEYESLVAGGSGCGSGGCGNCSKVR